MGLDDRRQATGRDSGGYPKTVTHIAILWLSYQFVLSPSKNSTSLEFQSRTLWYNSTNCTWAPLSQAFFIIYKQYLEKDLRCWYKFSLCRFWCEVKFWHLNRLLLLNENVYRVDLKKSSDNRRYLNIWRFSDNCDGFYNDCPKIRSEFYSTLNGT